MILAVLIALKLYDAYVTLKYEVEEPMAMGKSNDWLLDKENYIKDLIKWLWVLLGYLICNIIFLLKPIIFRS